MKTDIHPKYHVTTITCSCGEKHELGSTKESMKIEVCSKCHPFFTGTHRIVDARGRVERFQKKYGDSYK